MRVLTFGLAVSTLALLPAALATAQSSDEARYYHCSYSADGDKYWTAVETKASYEALAEQWKAFAKGKDGSVAYCFSRYRKDDPAYTSLDEVEAIGRLTAGAKKIDWSPRQVSAASSKPAKPSKPAASAASDADASRAAKKAEHEAKMKRYQEGLAAHEAAVAKYEKERQDFEADRAARLAAAKAAQEEAARKQAEHEAEVARVREHNRRVQAEYEAKLRAASGGQ